MRSLVILLALSSSFAFGRTVGSRSEISIEKSLQNLIVPNQCSLFRQTPLEELNGMLKSTGSKEMNCSQILDIYTKVSQTNDGYSKITDFPLDNLKNRSKDFKGQREFAQLISKFTMVLYMQDMDIPYDRETKVYFDQIFEKPPIQGLSASALYTSTDTIWYGLTSKQKAALIELIKTRMDSREVSNKAFKKLDQISNLPYVKKDFTSQEVKSLELEWDTAWIGTQKVLGSNELKSQCLEEGMSGYKEAVARCPGQQELFSHLIYDKNNNSQVKSVFKSAPQTCEDLTRNLLLAVYKDQQIASTIAEIYKKHHVLPQQGKGSEGWDQNSLQELDRCYSKVPEAYKQNLPAVKIYKDKSSGDYSATGFATIFISKVDCHVVLHEFAHHIVDTVISQKNPQLFENWKKSGFDKYEYNSSYKSGKSSLELPKGRRFTSDYSRGSSDEDFAEYFSYMFDSPGEVRSRDSERSKLFFEVLDSVKKD